MVKNNSTYRSKNVLVFIVGLLSLVKIRLVGTLGLSELIIPLIVLFTPFTIVFRKKEGRRFCFMAFLWLIGVLLSDWYNNSPTENSLKGAFNVLFLIIEIPFVYWSLYDSYKRILYFCLGLGLSSLFNFYFQNPNILNDEVAYNVWIVYAYLPIFIAISGILYYRGLQKMACLVIEIFAVWSLWHMSRNVFLSMSLGVALMLFIGKINDKNANLKRIKFRKNQLAMIIILIVAACSVFYTYQHLASQGALGEDAYKKYNYQENSEIGLASGRVDFLISLESIKKNPIWGYGSYAEDRQQIRKKYLLSKGFDYIEEDSNIMAGHSYILGAWVYSGILGFLFFAYVFVLIIKFLKNGLFTNYKLIGILILNTFYLLWNLFFSPFANRLEFLYVVIMLILLINNELPKQRKNLYNYSIV